MFFDADSHHLLVVVRCGGQKCQLSCNLFLFGDGQSVSGIDFRCSSIVFWWLWDLGQSLEEGRTSQQVSAGDRPSPHRRFHFVYFANTIPLTLLTPTLFVKHRWLANKTSHLTRPTPWSTLVALPECHAPRVRKYPKEIANTRGLASANERWQSLMQCHVR